MDSARFHHARDTLAKLDELNIPYLFLRPYSPQLNPIEQFFSMIKSRYNAIRDTSASVEEKFTSVLSDNFVV
jgi:transposase